MSKDTLVVDIIESLGPVPPALDPARFEEGPDTEDVLAVVAEHRKVRHG